VKSDSKNLSVFLNEKESTNPSDKNISTYATKEAI
jgi:hypothetical protein